MKTLRKMSMLVFIPIVLGIGLLVGGSVADNETAYRVGVMFLTVGIPVTMFVLVVVGLVLMITGKIDMGSDQSGGQQTTDDNTPADDDDDEWVSDDEDDSDEWESSVQKPQSEREREYAELNDINTSRGYSNREKNAEYEMRHAANAYKNASPKDKIKGWLFFGFLMTDFALIMVFGFLGIWIGAIVCMSLFGGTILIALLVTVIVQKISMSGGLRKIKNSDVLDGEVKSCVLSSTTSTGGRTKRINKVVYKVVIASGEGEYTAYTEYFYETGDKIKFCTASKHLATILDDDMLAELEDDDDSDEW